MGKCIEGKVFYLTDDNEWADYNCPDCNEGRTLEVARLDKRIAAFQAALDENTENTLWKIHWARQLRQEVDDHKAKRNELAKEIAAS